MKRLVGWVGLWLLLFSAMDFWGIRLWQIERAPWFGGYRTAMYEYVSWISPASFGLAENAYFVWINLFDAERQNWEWTFYTGNPLNPDGDYKFVYGDGARYEMWRWYRHWLKNFLPWLAALLVYHHHRRIVRTVRQAWSSVVGPRAVAMPRRSVSTTAGRSVDDVVGARHASPLQSIRDAPPTAEMP